METFKTKPKHPAHAQTDLDPDNWQNFREQAHRLLDACVDRLENAKSTPWQQVPQGARAKLSLSLPISPNDPSNVIDAMINDVMPYATGNTHPRFFGWVHGTGMANSLLAEMTASVMNSNCGGRDHGAIYVERCVMQWCKEIFDFPSDSSGLLTVGTSQATIIALVTARAKALGIDVRQTGIKDAPDMTVYCGEGTHSCVEKALQIMGHGSNALRKIKTYGASGGINVAALIDQIEQDINDGFTPLCVVATAGSVNTGAFDDINALADLCAEKNIWLHVDGAFGAWARIAEKPWSDLTAGIERADSIAFDFHKWMSVQYDCGAILIRDSVAHYDSFSMRPSYLAKQAQGLGGGDLWFCDLGTDLSRGFRALKVWTALQEHGLDAFSSVITQNCKHAEYMATLIEQSDRLKLAAPIVSNVCTFHIESEEISPEEQDTLNEKVVHELQLNGDAVFSTTKINNRIAVRAAIVNHRTQFEDIGFAMNAVLDMLSKIEQ